MKLQRNMLFHWSWNISWRHISFYKTFMGKVFGATTEQEGPYRRAHELLVRDMPDLALIWAKFTAQNQAEQGLALIWAKILHWSELWHRSESGRAGTWATTDMHAYIHMHTYTHIHACMCYLISHRGFSMEWKQLLKPRKWISDQAI